MGRHDVGSAPLGRSPVLYLTLMNQIVHRPDCFFYWSVRVRTVAEEQVQVFQLQSFERVAAGLEDVLARQTLVVWSFASPEDLARNNQVLATPAQFLDHVPHYRLCVSIRVGLCIVEEVDPSVVGAG